MIVKGNRQIFEDVYIYFALSVLDFNALSLLLYLILFLIVLFTVVYHSSKALYVTSSVSLSE